MEVITLTNAPPGVAGFLTRYYLEVSTNVFVGTSDALTRTKITTFIKEFIKNGEAVIVTSRPSTPQGFTVEVIINNARKQVQNHEGIELLLEKVEESSLTTATGWSNAHRYQNARKFRK